ncbi:MAG: hypothetical protein OEZ04_13380, partial [Nitrospinota bacterium]|nr:hypothetical protein [Nitrospinota bacterium]
VELIDNENTVVAGPYPYWPEKDGSFTMSRLKQGDYMLSSWPTIASGLKTTLIFHPLRPGSLSWTGMTWMSKSP